MRNARSLPSVVAEQLDALRKRLGVSQADLAGAAGVAQGTVSNALRGKPIDAESVSKLLGALSRMIGDLRSRRDLSPKEAEDCLDILARAEAAAGVHTESASFLALPGGAVPPHAANLLPRTAIWEQMERALSRSHPCSILVDGPPMAGKSTMLGRLAAEARQRGFSVVAFDCCEFANEKSLAPLLRGLVRAIETETGLPRPPAEPSYPGDVQQWLYSRRARSPHPPILLILDQTADLPSEIVRSLLGLVRILHNYRGAMNLSLAFGGLPLSFSHEDLAASSGGAFQPQIEVGWLAPREIEGLAHSGEEMGVHPEDLEWVMVMLEGQPFLSHGALKRLSDFKTRRAENPEGPPFHPSEYLIATGFHAQYGALRLRYQTLLEDATQKLPELRQAYDSYPVAVDFPVDRGLYRTGLFVKDNPAGPLCARKSPLFHQLVVALSGGLGQ